MLTEHSPLIAFQVAPALFRRRRSRANFKEGEEQQQVVFNHNRLIFTLKKIELEEREGKNLRHSHHYEPTQTDRHTNCDLVMLLACK